MDKKHIGFIVLLTFAAFFLWLAGEILIAFVFNLGGTASAVWTVLMIIVTFALSVYKCCFSGNSESKRKNNSRKW